MVSVCCQPSRCILGHANRNSAFVTLHEENIMKRNILTLSGIFAALMLTGGVANASFGSTLSDTANVTVKHSSENDQLARRGRGADDGAGHTRGGGRGRGKDDGPNHTMQDNDQNDQLARRGRGADDGAGHTRGGGRGRGKDDAPNHG
jgi:hypothetical protein